MSAGFLNVLQPRTTENAAKPTVKIPPVATTSVGTRTSAQILPSCGLLAELQQQRKRKMTSFLPKKSVNKLKNSYENVVMSMLRYLN